MSRHGRRDRRTSKKILATVVVAGTTAAAIGAGTFAAFTGSDSAAQTVDTATMALAFDATGQASLDADISNAVPGDAWQRVVELTLTGDFADTDGNLDFTAVGDDATLDPELTVDVDSCAVPWTDVDADGNWTCVAPASLVNDAALSGTEHSAIDTYSAAPETKYLRLTTSFDPTAGNSVQGMDTNITYTFTIDQRVADATR